jgi:hypothetical protein
MWLDYKEIFYWIIVPLLLGFLGWLSKVLYDKFISIRPRLFLFLEKPLYSQCFLGFGHDQHELTWSYHCVLKNNSKYTAYNIEIFEVADKKQQFVFNKTNIKNTLPENNHIATDSSQNFEIAAKTRTSELSNYVLKNGEKKYSFGLKIENPKETLKPKELSNIKLIVKYRNQKGHIFYTKYNEGKNKICFFEPFLYEKKQMLK